MPDGASAVTATVRGLIRGRELAGPGTLEVGEREILIRLETPLPAGGRASLQRTVTLPLDAVDGVEYHAADDEMVLYLVDGDVVELSGAGGGALAALRGDVLSRAQKLAELTRALRALGSHRAPTGHAHDRFFGPLLEARRRAERARTAAARLEAFDPAALRARLDESLSLFAAERGGESAPDRRALQAELEELAEPIGTTLDALAEAARSVRDSGDETKLLAWRTWSASVAELFACADRCWIAIARSIDEAPPPPPTRWWRRVWPRRGTFRRGRGA